MASNMKDWDGLRDYHRAEKRLNEAVAVHNQRIDRLKQFKTDYDSLFTLVKELPEKTRHSIMVPIGKGALMPGFLKHTNELLVLLGDDYFVERSATQTCDIIQRRIQYLDSQLEDAQKERRFVQQRLDGAKDLGLSDQMKQYEEEEIVEIKEEYNSDEEEAAMRSRVPEPKREIDDAEYQRTLDLLAELERREKAEETAENSGDADLVPVENGNADGDSKPSSPAPTSPADLYDIWLENKKSKPKRRTPEENSQKSARLSEKTSQQPVRPTSSSTPTVPKPALKNTQKFASPSTGAKPSHVLKPAQKFTAFGEQVVERSSPGAVPPQDTATQQQAAPKKRISKFKQARQNAAT